MRMNVRCILCGVCCVAAAMFFVGFNVKDRGNSEFLQTTAFWWLASVVVYLVACCDGV